MSQPKSTYSTDFIMVRTVRGMCNNGIYRELTGRTQAGHYTNIFPSEEAPETLLQAPNRY